ncbi:MAG: flagellar assembly protein FliW [Thermodesulfobacteriota bacterium]
MKRIQTSRFGTIEIEENRIIHFPEGLLGFPLHRDYVLLDHKPDSPFCWLQSTDVPELAFVLTNPFRFMTDYLRDLSPEEQALFEVQEGGERVILNLVTIPTGQVEKTTVNLLGPLVIDATARRGKQVVLAGAGYSHRQPLFAK